MTDEVVTEFALEAMRLQGSPSFRLDGVRPDQEVRDAKAIDFLARSDGGVVLGIEHTRIEPYEGFLADWNLAHERLGPVRDLLVGRLSADSVFNISIEPASATRIRPGDAQALAAWIEQTAPNLGPPPRHFATTPDGLGPTPLTLYRWPIVEGMPSEPRVRYRIGFDTARIHEPLVDRCRRALQTKLPKLEKSRDVHGAALTLLCLESSDVQLTDPFGFAQVVRDAAEGLPAPDHLVMVVVDPDDRPFMSWTYREPGRWLDRPHLYAPNVTSIP